MWIDRMICHVLHVSHSRSHFRIVSELLKFVGEGSMVHLGILKVGCSFNNSLQFKFDDLQKESKVLFEQLWKSIHVIEENNSLLHLAHSKIFGTESIVEQRRAVLLSNNLFKSELYGLQENPKFRSWFSWWY